ncbi:hypothetical protein GCM10023258_05010 [Terrabacter aeriphilus]|uniref:HEAT repeat protein n=1 Tax=Terrabacter aeriphilus TaxID=515662 RepID=A0ABP9J255_9MICO
MDRTARLDAQVRWVLRNARLQAADPALRTAAGFAEGAGRAAPVHRAQVGRWEGGQAQLGRALVRRYETVLGLPEGRLLAAVDLFSRSHEPVRAASTLPPPGPPDVEGTLALLERALAAERMTGLDWDRLSDHLGRMPHALVRAADWEGLLRRLLHEVSLGIGLDYVQRAEAVARLAGHPRSGAVVASLAAEVVARPDAPFYADTLSLLRFMDSPRVGLPVLLGQLREPTNASTLRACLSVLTALVRGTRLDPETRLEAVRLAVGHLRDPGHPYLVHRGAANLVRTLGPSGSRRFASVLTADDRRVAASIVRDGRAITASAIREAHRRIRVELEAGAGPESAAEPVLADLLETALGVTNEEDRSYALGVLLLSPQSRVVGRVHAAVLADALARSDHVAAHESATVLTWMGQPEDLDLFTRVALSPGRAPDVAKEAAYVVGNIREPAGPRRDDRETAFARRVVEVASPPGGRLEASAVQLLRGLVYALGMRGRHDLLAEVVQARPAMPASARATVDAWLTGPEHLRPLRQP